MPFRNLTKLKVPKYLVYQQDMGKFILKQRKPSIIIYCTDKQGVDQLNVVGQTAPIKGEKCDLFAIPKLFRNDPIHESLNIYSFGAGAAESHNPASILTVTWEGTPISVDPPPVELEDVYFRIENKSEVHFGNFDDAKRVNQYESFLFLEAGKTAGLLEIGQNQTQANSILVIFKEDGTFVEQLDPSQSGQTFYLNFDAWVIPFIKPTKFIRFEVGDPEDDGEVEYEDGDA